MDYRDMQYHLKYRHPQLIREREQARMAEAVLAGQTKRTFLQMIRGMWARVRTLQTPQPEPVIPAVITEKSRTGC